MNTCTMLNMTGDVTIAWDEKNNEEIKKWIQSKLDEGCTFFILEKKLGFIPVKKKVSSVEKLPEKGEVKIEDKDIMSTLNSSKPVIKNDEDDFFFTEPIKPVKLDDVGAEKLVSSGHAKTVVKISDYQHKVVKVSKDPNEIVKHSTMCSRRMNGG